MLYALLASPGLPGTAMHSRSAHMKAFFVTACGSQATIMHAHSAVSLIMDCALHSATPLFPPNPLFPCFPC